MAQSEFLWQSVLLKPAWVEETCLMFLSCLCVSSRTLPPCAENESWIPIWLFFFVTTDTRGLKATAPFPSLSSSEPSTSAMSTVRCWGWNLSEPLIKNREKQHPLKAKIWQTHQRWRKWCPRRQENIETSFLQSTESHYSILWNYSWGHGAVTGTSDLRG